MKHDALLARLRDIHGLDPIGAWPPGIGWWLLAAGILLLAALLFWLIRDLYRYPWGSWRRDARDRLVALRRRLARQPARGSAEQLSELMRRIAMARFKRDDCASLSGDAWLDWLEQHDPIGFPWATHAKLLTRLPYAPDDGKEGDEAGKRATLRLLIDAGLRWTAGKPRKSGHV